MKGGDKQFISSEGELEIGHAGNGVVRIILLRSYDPTFYCDRGKRNYLLLILVIIFDTKK